MDPPPKRMRMMDAGRGGFPDMGVMSGGVGSPPGRPSPGDVGVDHHVQQQHQHQQHQHQHQHQQQHFIAEQVDPRMPAKQRTWSRASSACQTCRGRKTKCDNERPICGYCRRVGATCTYIEDSAPATSLCQGVGPRLLGAIENLANLIQRNEENFRAIPQLSRDLSRDSTDYPDSPTFQGRHESGILGQDGGGDGANKWSKTNLSLSDTAGLDTVLEWPIFPKPVPFAIDPFSHASPRSSEVFSPRSPPAMEFYELSRLADLFLANVRPMNPVVEPAVLRQMIKQVAENGPDWSSATCIVALTCALGAISQRPGQRTPSGTPRGYSVEPNRHLAFRYWSVAEKRLGFSMGSPGWESVQCLCLAGIWHMYNMDPLQAWKCFSMASNTWYTTSLMNKLTMPPEKAETPSADFPQSLTLEQTLYFTCFKSECDLAFELSLPGSILAGVDYPYSLPAPPSLGVTNLDNKALMMEQRSWYYYLAEISARHLINRIAQAQKRCPPHPTETGIDRMLEVFEVFEAQLTDWYEQLAPPISFQVPAGDIAPLTDDLCQALRGRYLAMRELLCRPFVCLASTISVGITVSESTTARVAEIASRGLQYCLFRIQATSSSPHHGLWLQLRSFVTCSLLLTAAERAQTIPSLNMPTRLIYPQNWRRTILAQKDVLSNCWEFEEGGISDCAKVLDWALAKFTLG
ncbi:Putative zn(2)Cys(6) fungal-type DNA-binding domain-containing protein [Colletotrichum destructivum]|uniref:Zn(2)Cys(6) fungal-type DNA-binding domain-containing protein n=1 Tax=Colletotrichum destructivum TaxID=34406 RepID=A0AAX4HZQ3_9PEZI|nr:Putative zn(2)Cys(6) fungal-type DNA-binding domain-containing protein [Colletotrichum destructivum]